MDGVDAVNVSMVNEEITVGVEVIAVEVTRMEVVVVETKTFKPKLQGFRLLLLRQTLNPKSQGLRVLKSLEYEAIKKYRGCPLGKLEVVVSCKESFDHFMAQLSPKLRRSNHFEYPKRVSVYLNLMKVIELDDEMDSDEETCERLIRADSSDGASLLSPSDRPGTLVFAPTL
ncbi:uncharacterized protein A4U43_C07F28220 [Asparagus officinalis]|uniref:Uncharacterized protein n=1 Tax=Asparagus officinalis TaxID=4686 RepID=A0A5P1EFG9_ASPOF|nr:uncharacterized protein A4U43_C07F28220 [Asparagus officinalis]